MEQHARHRHRRADAQRLPARQQRTATAAQLRVAGQRQLRSRPNRSRAADALGAPSKFEISRELIRDGANEITIRRTSGAGPLYFSAEAKFFSLEEPITPAGNEIFVRRQYFKLVNHPTLLKGFVSERVPLNDGDTVKSGERVETVITIEAKNNYEYLLFEDLKPAGLEAVQLRSGENLYVKELKSGALAKAVQSPASNVQSQGRAGAQASCLPLVTVEVADELTLRQPTSPAARVGSIRNCAIAKSRCSSIIFRKASGS